ncbi:MAG: 3-deoxy-7-phosphoheptulonate synthase class II [Verrucomicrobiota bacterium]|nr:3-deoxy-7-phosphoheptulonate synthase [Limisphaera sp.]MDW8382417.1 3-deoxy-7-phosphoheptulonate synthase class II [Verrucomicrobiota bacterium]
MSWQADCLEWQPDSWQRKPARQQPVYPDPGALQNVLRQLHQLPPLVSSYEIECLKAQLAEAARGERFLLQGGDCSETFADCQSPVIAAKLKILLQMSLLIVHDARCRVIRVGRFAGQYAKPRSAETETRGGNTLPVYRGDLVNRPGFDPRDRTPDPELLLRGYERAALTLNFIRALIDGGFADLHHPENWTLSFARATPVAEAYQQRVHAVAEAIQFIETLTGASIPELQRVDFFTSHEGLHLLYEQALTRQVPRRTGWYNLGTHFPWIGNRTRDPDGAHVEYFRGIRNPIAVKIGPPITEDELLTLCHRLDPCQEPGRLTLITRFGVDQVARALPPLIDALQKRGRRVLWVCDPMHGNTETTASGLKTRRFERILKELELTCQILAEAGLPLAGVHFELSGEDVTECIGGACGLTEADLARAYRSPVDPRLNYEQSLEMALHLACLLRCHKPARVSMTSPAKPQTNLAA